MNRLVIPTKEEQVIIISIASFIIGLFIGFNLRIFL